MDIAVTCSAYLVNALSLMSILLFCISLVSAMSQPLPPPNRCLREPFTPFTYSSKSSHKYNSGYSHHISLTAPDNTSGGPSNMTTGTAQKHVSDKYSLDIIAYLYNLKGDVYVPQKDSQNNNVTVLSDSKGNPLRFGLPTTTFAKYKAYLGDNEGYLTEIGELKRHGDKSYRLHFESDDVETLESLDSVMIALEASPERKVPVLYGQF